MISIVDMVEYDLTLMAGDILEVINGNGYLGLTTGQREKVDTLVSKYAQSATDIVADSIEWNNKAAAAMLGASKSNKKTEAARSNGKKGGRPKKAVQ